eukprot:15351553-Ditylum_brightwellii.AAC.2
MNKMHLVHCPIHSIWFERFALGCRCRMGEIVKLDRAISIEQVLALSRILDNLGKEANSYEERRSMILLGSFVLIAYAGSFHGHEVFLVDTHGLLKYKDEGRKESKDNDYLFIPLLGRFKGETGEKYHLTPLAAKTCSGWEVRKWVDHLITLLSSETR